jgi:spermidine synthase
MATIPVLLLLIYDLIVFGGGIKRFRSSSRESELLLLCVLFFCSGMPALIYQIVWQRTLFSIYGVNVESVAVVVSVFMLGLGLGSLAGGWISGRYPRHSVTLFGISELGVALFGLVSLRVFHWAAEYTAGATLPATVLFSILLLIFPTMLMGATLPLLVQHFTRGSLLVGHSVAVLYFVNTFGSAVACYLCATFLMRDFGQSGSVMIAAGINIVVGLTAFALGARREGGIRSDTTPFSVSALNEPTVPLKITMPIAGLSGFIALGFEITWFRVFALASEDRAPAFALLLSVYLAGIAAGSYIAEKLSKGKSLGAVLRVIGLLILLAGATSVFLPPLIAFLQWKGVSFLIAAPAFGATAALLGAILPLLCQVSVRANEGVGRGVSWTYAANILGATLGSIVIGFIVMQHFGLKQVSLQLGAVAVFLGASVLFLGRRASKIPSHRALAPTLSPILAAIVAVLVGASCYSNFFERLIFGPQAEAVGAFSHVVENRNGNIAVTRGGAVMGNGVYDGYFNVDPTHDVNRILRAYALGAFHPQPKRILMIGLSSGSWAQVLANHPAAESLDVIEINPGYLRLIPLYPSVASLLTNPRVHIYLDDGRRWLLAHREARYDAIVMNTSFYWRDHSSNLLSVDFLKIIRQHLDPGGIYYYNTTESNDVIATGLSVFPYGLRVENFLAVSDSPIGFNEDRWMSVLKKYEINNQAMFDPLNQKVPKTLASYAAFAAQIDTSTTIDSLETSASLKKRLGKRFIITDDNMGWEWRTP